MDDVSSPIDTAAASAYTGLSRSTLEKLRVFGGGPPYLKLGRAVRYRPADLEAWLVARLTESTSTRGSEPMGQDIAA